MSASDESTKNKPHSHSTPPHSSGPWRVRSEDGDTFGPAAPETLCEWAADGRLAPNHEISQDGSTWMPVSRLPEVRMDWIVEVSNGAFYGPIHQQHLDELLREESVPADAAIFKRHAGTAPGTVSPGAEVVLLKKRLAEHEERFDRELTLLEEKLQSQQVELDKARADLNAKDLEFDAERQEFQSRGSRHQAELLKRDARVESLEKEISTLKHGLRHRHSMETRLADLEQHSAATQTRLEAELAAALEESTRQQARARKALRDMEQQRGEVTALRQQAQSEVESARSAQKQYALRQESVSKLLKQAIATMGVDPVNLPAKDPIVIEAAAVGEPEPPPAPGTPGGLSLETIEAQAQRELERLRTANPGKGGAPWKKRGGAR